MEYSQVIDLIKAGDLETLQKEYACGKWDLDAVDEHGWTALSWAAGQGKLPIVQWLADKGCDLIHRGKDERTPWEIAMAASQVEVARFLEANMKPSNGTTSQGNASTQNQSQSTYCKAYPLRALSAFSQWAEQAKVSSELAENVDAIMFLHADYTVTENIWRDEDIIWNNGSDAWITFCSETLKFKVPSDYELLGI